MTAPATIQTTPSEVTADQHWVIQVNGKSKIGKRVNTVNGTPWVASDPNSKWSDLYADEDVTLIFLIP